MEIEQVFSLLNSQTVAGKNPARMCKILDSLSLFSHGIWRRFLRPFYLLEGLRLRSMLSPRVGYGIAFFLRQPALLRIRSGKD
jgi:hypothetical protein